jgi:cyclase
VRPARYLATAVLFFAGVAGAQAPAAPAANPLPFTLKPLGHNVWAAIDDTKGNAGANAGFVVGDDGLAVIDTFENPDAVKQMLAEIGKLTGLPVKFVIVTQYHIDP